MEIVVSRPGQTNSAGDTRALFEKVFSGEVLTTYEAENVFMALHRVRNIDHGKSAAFALIGNIGAGHYRAGALSGGKINHAETTINIDDPMIAHVAVPDFDEMLNHYDIRGPYTTELGRALAVASDERIARTIARAARTVGALTGTRYANYGASGAIPSAAGSAARDTSLANANAATSASVLSGLILTACQRLDERNAVGERFVAIGPAQFWMLVNTTGGVGTSILNQDVGGSGSVSTGTLGPLGGAKFVKSIAMPQLQWSKDSEGMNVTTGTQGDITSDTRASTGANNYNGDFSKTVALVFGKEAVGTVRLKALEVQNEYSVRHQSTLLVARYAQGHGVLRPEWACEITSGEVAAAKVLPND